VKTGLDSAEDGPASVIRTYEELAARREELLAEVGLDLETLRERGEDGMLSLEQAPVLRELENLTSLMGE
jgi:hypothetical protein